MSISDLDEPPMCVITSMMCSSVEGESHWSESSLYNAPSRSEYNTIGSGRPATSELVPRPWLIVWFELHLLFLEFASVQHLCWRVSNVMNVKRSCIRFADMRSYVLTAHLLLKYLPIGSQIIICKHAVVFQKLHRAKESWRWTWPAHRTAWFTQLNMEEGMRGRHKLNKTREWKVLMFIELLMCLQSH